MSPKYTRRQMLWEAGGGLAGIALAGMLARDQARAAASTSQLRQPSRDFAPKAKSVIMVFLPGGISHVDTFDRKPALEKHHGQETRGANTITPFFGRRGTVMKSPFEFKPYGQTGHWVSEILPNLGGVVDDLTFVHSMVARSNAHGPALFQMSTGFIFQGFPAIGSWVSYGLGSENENLPSFVVLPDRRGLPPCGAALWGNGFLPASHQGVILGGAEMPIADLAPPRGISGSQQTASYDLLGALNHEHLKLHEGEDALAARIKAYELAARMQISAPAVTDISRESQATREMYGIDDPVTRDFGWNCLMARRLVEKGVRCVQMYNGGHFGEPRVNWDGHEDLRANHTKNARILDKPLAALLRDLPASTDSPCSLTMSTSMPGKAPHAEPGFVFVTPGSGVIIMWPVSVCHQVSTIGQRSPPMTR